ncbi:(Fe-S)-binding protein [Dehalobacter sp. DCM]|uniref:(Fe-S)-binding protein n=1 Tax=Dehalobacter sp. DCM TaxID=2907827 RepID=UPI00308154B8|nr:(Fe-S)-binding protein [Dehalobacter sp. DCM]
MSEKVRIPYETKEKDLKDMFLYPVAVEDQPRAAITLLGEMLKYKRSLKLYLDVCTHCGACVEQCHSYLGTKDPYNMPVARVDLVRSIYKKVFGPGPSFLRDWDGAKAISQETIDLWYTYFHQCNQCRRCAMFCPKGIDTAEVTIAIREILAHLGLVSRFHAGIVKNMNKTGNNMGTPHPAIMDGIEFLEEELKEETGLDIPIPMDQEGAEVLFNPSSSDLFNNTDGLMAVAKIFYKAGVSWTLSSQITETANFGLFFHEPTLREHSRRLVMAGKELGVKRLVAGECGHGWRTWRMFTQTLNGPLPFPVLHLFEEVLGYYRAGRIQFDKTKNPEVVTYHDPCNYARAGDLIQQPRELLAACVQNFKEMTPTAQYSFCCGGGSGILMDEAKDIRMALGQPKAECVRSTGAEILCAPCAICKAQLPDVMKHHKVDVKVKGLSDLLGRALIL